MGTNTTLSGITFSANADNNGQIYGADLVGLLSAAQVKAGEMIQLLNAIVGRLPGGDPNITTINTLISNLS